MAKLSAAQFDVPAVFILAMFLVLVPVFALGAVLMHRLGLPGPVTLGQ